jgi:hypothetical protein
MNQSTVSNLTAKVRIEHGTFSMPYCDFLTGSQKDDCRVSHISKGIFWVRDAMFEVNFREKSCFHERFAKIWIPALRGGLEFLSVRPMERRADIVK